MLLGCLRVHTVYDMEQPMRNQVSQTCVMRHAETLQHIVRNMVMCK